jgi:hypothetical protein
MQRFEETGSVRCDKAERRQHLALGEARRVLLALIAEQPDMTLDEVVAAMRKRRIAVSRSAVWRFFDRRNISFKKTLYASEQRRADVVRARRRLVRTPSPAALVCDRPVPARSFPGGTPAHKGVLLRHCGLSTKPGQLHA